MCVCVCNDCTPSQMCCLNSTTVCLMAVPCTVVQEQEKADLLESYRALSDETERLTSTAQQSMGEVSGTRLELSAMAQEKQHLAELVQQQASEIQQV